MDYQRIVDELRRKAEALESAAQTIEDVYLSGAENGATVGRPAQRWAPGTGQPAPAMIMPPSPSVEKVELESPVPTVNARPPRRRGRPPASRADVAIVERGDAPTVQQQIVDAARSMVKMGVMQQVLKKTLVNWCAAQGLPTQDDVIEEALAASRRVA